MTASVTHIWRHPIKSHGREQIASVDLTAGMTMPWDRTWAVRHEASTADGTKWEQCVNFSRGAKAPALMALDAKLDEANGAVTLSHPELGQLTFDPDLNPDRFLDWVRPLMPPERAQSAQIVRVPGRGMTDTDFPSISLMNHASHRAVSQRAGQELSVKRWRGNIWLDGLGPWEEFEWLDRSVQIGEAVIRIRDRIQRCRATTANPDTGSIDVDLLRVLNQGWDHQDFGVYGEVIKSGRIAVGDRLDVVS